MESIEDLVIKSNEDYTKAKPITTSDRIAKYSGYSKQVVDNLIRNHLKDFKLVGNGDVPLLKSEPQKSMKFDGSHNIITYFVLDEEQAYFLMTLMRNNERTIKFKAKLVNAFFSLKHIISKSNQTKPIAIAYNKSFHDTINIFNGGEETDFIKWSYKLYNDLVYKKIIGETAKQRRQRLSLKKDANVDNTLTAEEHNQKMNLELLIRNTAIKNNWHKLPTKECYDKVKQFLFGKE